MASSVGQGDIAVIILAAGQGTRMKSALPKVLHKVGGLPMLHHTLNLAAALNAQKVCVVVGPTGDAIAASARAHTPDIDVAIQSEPLGTAHAVLAARDTIDGFSGDVLVLYADTPLIRPETAARLVDARRKGADVAVLGFTAPLPNAYGRLMVADDGTLDEIVEAKDATEDQLKVDLCNSGLMAVNGEKFLPYLDAVGNANAKGEYYLTDVVAIARQEGGKSVAIACDEREVLGVNSRLELAHAERIFQDNKRNQAMADGATLLDPDTVYFSFDTKLGRDVVVGQNVVFGPGVTIADNVTIQPFCHFENAKVASGATLGPYARLRPGADIGESAHIGNFVEIKKAVVEQGAKVNHLTYIGDAFIGAGANIGAGTITCNYDGFDKHQTHIGRGVFIGSNNSLVAPVTIADGAYTGSGSVISKDVSADALALERTEQTERPGWAKNFRDKKQSKRQKDS